MFQSFASCPGETRTKKEDMHTSESAKNGRPMTAYNKWKETLVVEVTCASLEKKKKSYKIRELTGLAIAEISNPEILVVGVDKGDESGGSVHTESCFPPVCTPFVLVIDDMPNFSVRIVIQVVHRSPK